MSTLKAFIFDLDGVLTDTAEYHYQAWKELADELGYSFDRSVNQRLKGVSRQRSFEIILEVNNAADKKNQQYVKLIDRITPKDVLPGMMSFLSDAKAHGIKLAVASASKNADKVLNLLEIHGMFDYCADASKISKTKPDPEVFLDCANALGINPCECIGFEDAQAGIEAIHAAGMFSVGINVEVTSQEPMLHLGSTSELSLEKVQKAFERGVV